MTTNLINKLAEQMLEAAKIATEKVHVCYWKKEIKPRPAKHILKVHPTFGIYTIDEIKKGLTSTQWFALGERVGTFLRSKKQ